MICDRNNRFICKHKRSYKGFPNYYRRWASAYGECTAELIDQVLRSAKHEEQAYNSCAGILHSCKAIPHGIVEEAARKCMLVSIHTLKES